MTENFCPFFALSYTQSHREWEHLISDFVSFFPAQKPVTSIRETGKCVGSSKKEKKKISKERQNRDRNFRWQQEEWCIVVRQKSVQLLLLFSLFDRSIFLSLSFFLSQPLQLSFNGKKEEKRGKKESSRREVLRTDFLCSSLSSHTFCMRLLRDSVSWMPSESHSGLENENVDDGREWESEGKAGHGNEEGKREIYIRIIDEHVIHRFTDLTGWREGHLFPTWKRCANDFEMKADTKSKILPACIVWNWSVSHRETFPFRLLVTTRRGEASFSKLEIPAGNGFKFRPVWHLNRKGGLSSSETRTADHSTLRSECSRAEFFVH